MKKAGYILFGIFTFLLGVWLFQLRAYVIAVPITDVLENSEIYQSKKIYVKAFLAEGGYYDMRSSMQAVNYKNGQLSGAIIEISEELKNDETFQKLRKELDEKIREPQYGMQDGWAVVEVEITGEFEENRNKSGGLVDFSDFKKLKAEKIIQLSPIRFIKPGEVSLLDIDLDLD
jgi:hypothetical protein